MKKVRITKAEKQDKSKPWDIFKISEPDAPKCKTCKKNPRRQSSAYCGDCSLKFHSEL